jgi:hypothetical protein
VHYIPQVCENGYSEHVAEKSKTQNTLHMEPDINLKLSTLQPDSQFLKAAEEKRLRVHALRRSEQILYVLHIYVPITIFHMYANSAVINKMQINLKALQTFFVAVSS